MHLDTPFLLTELCPFKERHTEVYGGAVKRIDVAFQIKHFVFALSMPFAEGGEAVGYTFFAQKSMGLSAIRAAIIVCSALSLSLSFLRSWSAERG